MIDFKHYDLKLTKYIKIFRYLCLDLTKKIRQYGLFAYFQYICEDIAQFYTLGELRWTQ